MISFPNQQARDTFASFVHIVATMLRRVAQNSARCLNGARAASATQSRGFHASGPSRACGPTSRASLMCGQCVGKIGSTRSKGSLRARNQYTEEEWKKLSFTQSEPAQTMSAGTLRFYAERAFVLVRVRIACGHSVDAVGVFFFARSVHGLYRNITHTTLLLTIWNTMPASVCT
eukprot:9029772-Pyramimonas_sp.AAC.1